LHLAAKLPYTLTGGDAMPTARKAKPLLNTSPPNPARERKRQLHDLAAKLHVERTAKARWMPRLKRAFTAVIKIDQRITRLERLIAQLNNS
jgi:hypothetical protein